ncbi:hypothetical protein quinque_006195 [Culex quinquefasciatus]
MAPTFSVVFILCCGLLLLLMAATTGSTGTVEATSRVERNSTESFRRVTRDRRRYCGKVLTDALAMVCTSYPSPWRKKSMEPSSTSSDEETSAESTYREQLLAEIKQDLDELEQLSPEMFAEKSLGGVQQFHPFYPRSYQVHANEARGAHRRVRRQIVDECCRKSCTMKTLKQYCAD